MLLSVPHLELNACPAPPGQRRRAAERLLRPPAGRPAPAKRGMRGVGAVRDSGLFGVSSLDILWMDRIRSHLRNHDKPSFVGIHRGRNIFRFFLGCAGFRPSTVWFGSGMSWFSGCFPVVFQLFGLFLKFSSCLESSRYMPYSLGCWIETALVITYRLHFTCQCMPWNGAGYVANTRVSWNPSAEK